MMLVNVPRVNQLTPNTNDGMPSDNARADCVAAVASGCAQALGAPAYTPDWWKDAAYSEQYVGGTDPLHYAPVFARLGLALHDVGSSSGDELVAIIRAQLHAGYPVMGAIPSQWGTSTAADIAAHGGPTHEIGFCDDDGARLTAMNPWPFSWTGGNAWYQTMSYAWWASRLVYNRVNPVVRGAALMWQAEKDAAGAIVGGRDAAGHTCGTGCLDYLQTHGLAGVDGRGSEQFYTPDRAFLELASGAVVRALHNSDGSWTIDGDGAAVVADLWAAVQAANASRTVAATPKQLAAESVLDAVAAYAANYH